MNLFNLNIKNKKKGISPIISVVLLIVIAVIMVSIFLTWGKTTTVDSLEKAKSNFDVKNDFDCADIDLVISNVVIDSVTKDLNFTIENKFDIDVGGIIISIFGYTYDGNYTKLEGIFNNYLEAGYIQNYSTTDDDFVYTTNNDINYFDINSIDFILITNSTCTNQERRLDVVDRDYIIYNSLEENLVAEFLLDGEEYTFEDQELVLNNSFDYNLDNWTIVKESGVSSQVVHDNVVYYSKPGSARIDIEDGWAQLDQTINVIPNTKYLLSFKFLSTSGNTIFRIKNGDSDLSYNLESKKWVEGDYWINITSKKNMWSDYNLSFFTNEYVDNFKLTLYYDNSKYNKFYFDNVSLRPIKLINSSTQLTNEIIPIYDFEYNNKEKGSIFLGVSNSYITHEPISFNDGEAWSVSFWVNPLIENDFSFVIGNKDSGSYGLTFKSLDNYSSAFRLNGDYYLFYPVIYNKFQHYVITSSEDKVLKLYIDGILVKSEVAEHTDITYNNIGSAYQGSTNWYTGFFSDYKIYDKEINSKEVFYLYNISKDKFPKNFVPYYKDLVLHVDANSMVEEYNDGEPINYFKDLSPKENHLEQRTSEYMPIFKKDIMNGLPVIGFNDNSESYLETQRSSGFSGSDFDISVFAVFKLLDTPTKYMSILSQYYDSGKQCFSVGVFGNYNGRATADYWAPAGRLGSTYLSLDTDYLLSYIIPSWETNNLTTDIYLNGVKENSSSFGSWSNPNLKAAPFRIGNWDIIGRDDMTFTGDIAEILVYKRALTNEERKIVDSYLKTKYDIK